MGSRGPNSRTWRECAYCGASFRASLSHARFCSPRCNERDWDLREVEAGRRPSAPLVSPWEAARRDFLRRQVAQAAQANPGIGLWALAERFGLEGAEVKAMQRDLSRMGVRYG